jgi:hypothetical protein
MHGRANTIALKGDMPGRHINDYSDVFRTYID